MDNAFRAFAQVQAIWQRPVPRVLDDLAALTARMDPIAGKPDQHMVAGAGLVAKADTPFIFADAALEEVTGIMQTDQSPVLNDNRATSDRIGSALRLLELIMRNARKLVMP